MFYGPVRGNARHEAISQRRFTPAVIASPSRYTNLADCRDDRRFAAMHQGPSLSAELGPSARCYNARNSRPSATITTIWKCVKLPGSQLMAKGVPELKVTAGMNSFNDEKRVAAPSNVSHSATWAHAQSQSNRRPPPRNADSPIGLRFLSLVLFARASSRSPRRDE